MKTTFVDSASYFLVKKILHNTLNEFEGKKVSVYFSKSKHSQRSKIIKAGLCNSEHALSM